MHFGDVKFLAQKSGRVKFLTNFKSYGKMWTVGQSAKLEIKRNYTDPLLHVSNTHYFLFLTWTYLGAKDYQYEPYAVV